MTQTQGETVDVNWDYHPRQIMALDILDLQEDVSLCYGGAKGGGKTVLGTRWATEISYDIIKQFQISPSPEPVLIGFMGRKRSTDFTKTTLETFRNEVPSKLYRINEHKSEIVFGDSVKWFFGGFDDRDAVQKFNSGEYIVLFIDQAEEITEREHSMIAGTLRKKINGLRPFYKELLTCNPAQCWLKREFVKNPEGKKHGRYFLKALPKDNPYLADGYVDKLRYEYRNQPELIEAYIEGSWDVLDSENCLIRDIWVQQSKEQAYPFKIRRKIISCDPARFGKDRTTIGYAEETDLQDVEIYGQKDTYYTSNKIARMALRHSEDGTVEGTPLIVIDADGIGGAIADNLIAWGYKVLQVNSASESSDKEKFYNLRAEMWWNASQMYSDGDVYNSYGNMSQDDMDELDTELTIVGFSLRSGRILVESKDEIKDPKRYGKSPDLADMYVMLLYGLRFVTPKAVRDRVGYKDSRKRPKSAMVMG